MVAYKDILTKATKVLKNNRFFVIVVGDVRDEKTGGYVGFVNFTKACLRQAGLKEWNEVILLNVIGSASMRASNSFNATRKLGKIHQNVIIYYKGDQKEIRNNFKELDLDY